MFDGEDEDVQQRGLAQGSGMPVSQTARFFSQVIPSKCSRETSAEATQLAQRGHHLIFQVNTQTLKNGTGPAKLKCWQTKQLCDTPVLNGTPLERVRSIPDNLHLLHSAAQHDNDHDAKATSRNSAEKNLVIWDKYI